MSASTQQPTRLSNATLASLPQGVGRPTYDRDRVSVGIVHFGVGGFHRAHEAMYVDRLMNRGLALGWGICGVGVLPADRRMREALGAQDGLYTLMVKNPDGTATVWMIEGNTPNGLLRRGFTKKSLEPGTEVMIKGYMARSGDFKANGSSMTFKDGRKLFLGSSSGDEDPTAKDGK